MTCWLRFANRAFACRTIRIITESFLCAGTIGHVREEFYESIGGRCRSQLPPRTLGVTRVALPKIPPYHSRCETETWALKLSELASCPRRAVFAFVGPRSDQQFRAANSRLTGENTGNLRLASEPNWWPESLFMQVCSVVPVSRDQGFFREARP